MVFLPQICQTIFCILYPAATLIIPPVAPSTINLLTGKFIPNPTEMTISSVSSAFQFKRPFSYRPQQQSIVKPTSFAEKLLNSLANKNPIINVTIGNLNNDIIDAGPIPTKIYGSGTESKFPPFFEGLVQRVQSLFSIYKYPDLSRPGNAIVVPPVIFSRPTLIPRISTTTIKPISISESSMNDDYNEVLGNDNIENEDTNINNEQDIIKIGEDDEPGLELRLNVNKS